MVPLDLGVALIYGGHRGLGRGTSVEIVGFVGASVDCTWRVGIVCSSHFYSVEIGIGSETAVDFGRFAEEIAILSGKRMVEAHAEAVGEVVALVGACSCQICSCLAVESIERADLQSKKFSASLTSYAVAISYVFPHSTRY